MNRRAVWAIVRKDVMVALRTKAVALPLVIVPLILLVGLPLLLGGVIMMAERSGMDGRDISETPVVLDIAAALGVDRDAYATAIGTQEIKDRLKQETDAAIALGVFGVPYITVDGEPFWGADRLPQIEKWLETGGF